MIAVDNIAKVVSYFDEEGEVPADYVLKWSNDFEAFVAKIENETLDAISIGHFPTLSLAVRAIDEWNALDNDGCGFDADFNPIRSH